MRQWRAKKVNFLPTFLSLQFCTHINFTSKLHPRTRELQLGKCTTLRSIQCAKCNLTKAVSDQLSSLKVKTHQLPSPHRALSPTQACSDHVKSSDDALISENVNQHLLSRVYLRVTRTVRVTILSRQNMGYKKVMHSLSGLCAQGV